MRGALLLIVSLMALLTAQCWLAERHDGAYLEGELHDSNSYMRLVRVRNLIEGGDWHDHAIARANAPHGHTLHWSRPLDALLLAGAASMAPILGWTDGLHQAGVWLSPLLHVLTLLALLWAMRPLLVGSGFLWLGLLFPLQLFLDYQFAPGRPNHHALILLLFVCALGAQIRALPSKGLFWAAVLALPLGLMAWVSFEGLLAAALALSLFLARWLRHDGTSARQGMTVALGMLLISSVAVFIEHPIEDLFIVVYDKISIVYVVLLSLTVIAFAIAAFAPYRWLGLIAFAAIPIVQFLLFPNILHGPLAGQDAVFAAAIFQYAGETSPVSSGQAFLLHFGPACLALPHGIWHLRRGQGQGTNRWPWILLTAGLALYLPLAVLQVRWAPYVSLLALPGYCAILTSILRRFSGNHGPVHVFTAAMAQTAVVLGFGFGFLLLGAQIPGDREANLKCPQDAMAEYLDRRYKKPQRILSYMTIAPAILYRGPHEVIATPYFRNAQGGRDTMDFFRAMDVQTAFEIADRRGIDLVLTCPADRESRLYRLDRPLPIWLEAVELPPRLGRWYRLYRVLL